MRISEYLRTDFVVTRLEARDTEGVLREISAKAGRAGLADAEVIADKLLERERSHTTAMGDGLAIPHATVPGLPAPVVGIARSGEPIPFGPEGEQPVEVFFVLLSPPDHESTHVRLLARICRIARDDSFLERLNSATSASAIVDVVEQLDASHV
jgi:PTS system nitrogen regulatory IIA component